MNVTLGKLSRKRGKYVEKTFRDLKLQYGAALAKDIRTRKKELGKEWYRDHPELPGNEET